MKRIAFNTLGCRLNQYETDSIATDFINRDYSVVSWEEQADVYVINTCTVTNRSDRKCRNLINRALRKDERERIKPVVVVTGCYVENGIDSIYDRDSITYMVDNDRKAEIFQIVDAHFRGETVDLESLPADRFRFGEAEKGFHTRSSLKIQDGCDNYCTFCIIPFVRGAAQSRSDKDILNQVWKNLDYGAKELVITGVNIGRYRYGSLDFSGLLEKILDIRGDFRVRVSSIEPDTWGEGFLKVLNHPKLCPHLHLCLQSGSDGILVAMGRHYSMAEYLDFVDKLMDHQPDMNITTDIMVGFPGETEQDFEETCNVAKHVGFSHIHTFPYSVRNGTKASQMENQVDAGVKAERGRIIREISNDNKTRYRRKMLGKGQRVLVESIKEGLAHGYGEHYLPVDFEGSSVVLNTFEELRLDSLGKGKDPVYTGTKHSK